jgi:hypothetical protein
LILCGRIRKIADVQSPTHAVTYSCQNRREHLPSTGS